MTHPLARSFALFAGVALLTTAACTPTESYWSEVQSPKQNKIEPVSLLHDVRFASGARMSPVEVAQLDHFLTRHDVGYGDRVYILMERAAGTGPAARRADEVRRYMAAQGIKAMELPSPEATPGLVRVVVQRHVVVPPNCPDWSKPGTSDYGNTPMSNLGCATTTNLGLMLADPGELVHGRAPGAADGAGSVLSIQRYRADKIKPLENSGTATGGKQK